MTTNDKTQTTPVTVTKPVVETQTVVAEPKPNFSHIISMFPDQFTPATLDKAFNINDGGKTVRRHLRKHFAAQLEHNHNEKWGFNKTTAVAIIEYFAAKYIFNPDAFKSNVVVK